MMLMRDIQDIIKEYSRKNKTIMSGPNPGIQRAIRDVLDHSGSSLIVRPDAGFATLILGESPNSAESCDEEED